MKQEKLSTWWKTVQVLWSPGMWILNKFNRRCLYYYRYLQYFKKTTWFLFTLMSLTLTYISSNNCWGPKRLSIRMYIFTPC
jgi:hypothetical protein